MGKFTSKAEWKACFARNDPKWDCKKWTEGVVYKNLPDYVTRRDDNGKAYKRIRDKRVYIKKGGATTPTGAAKAYRRTRRKQGKGNNTKKKKLVKGKRNSVKQKTTHTKTITLTSKQYSLLKRVLDILIEGM